MNEMRLFDTEGNRLYITPSERDSFLDVARKQRAEVRTFAETLVYTGCRISEGLEFSPKRVEADHLRVVLRSLKNAARMSTGLFQCHCTTMEAMNMVHGIREAQKSP